MALDKVWIRTLADGLIRADQIVGLASHSTPALTGKPPRWLLDATMTVPTGSGNADGWDIGILHRTLIQTPAEPLEAPETLARLLAGLHDTKTGGVITPVAADPPSAAPHTSGVKFTFTPFTDSDQADSTSNIDAQPTPET